MKIDLNQEKKTKFLTEIGRCLERAGFQTGTEKDGLLPVFWNGESLCRVNAAGGAQFRKEELESEGAEEAFHNAVEVAAQSAEYMRLMGTASHLKAKGLDGDYRLLADFNGTVLAGHPTAQGVQFVTWEWDYEHTGMWQGHYYGSNYPGAKQDFAVRAGLIPKILLFEQSELDELYRCCQRTRELDDTLSYYDEQKVIRLQEHMEDLSPGIGERFAALERPVNTEEQIEQSMI